MIPREIEGPLRRQLGRGKSILLLGPRQTGKSTLVDRFQVDLSLDLILPGVRQRYERQPDLLVREVEELAAKSPRKKRLLIALDEVQKAPAILDVVQHLHDRTGARFILTGSSARKLKRGGANLLPGRVILFRLDPLSMTEMEVVPDLESLLLYGSLPAIHLESDLENRERDLKSYVETYLEEEVRSEALVRNLGSFGRFLELAASESGRTINLSKMSQEVGVAHTTIASYYQILEDCLIAERIEPMTESRTRRKLIRAHRFLFFDMGVRRLAAGEGARLPKETLGRLFEHWVGLELLRLTHLRLPKAGLRFWKDPDGPEVDWVLETPAELIPIEVKWSEAPGAADTRHLEVFLDEHRRAHRGLVVCRTPRAFSIGKRIRAIPWQELPENVA